MIWSVSTLNDGTHCVISGCLLYLSCFASSLLWCLSYGPLVTGLLTTFLLFFLLVDADTITIAAHLDYPRCLWDRTLHLLLDSMVLWFWCVFGLCMMNALGLVSMRLCAGLMGRRSAGNLPSLRFSSGMTLTQVPFYFSHNPVTA